MSDFVNPIASKPFVKPEEVWPFHNTECGAILQQYRYYGFGDAGGIAGDFNGYDTPEKAKSAIMHEYGITDESEISFKLEDLGGVSIAILSGRQFIDFLYKLGDSENDPSRFLEFGFWENMTEERATEMRNTCLIEQK